MDYRKMLAVSVIVLFVILGIYAVSKYKMTGQTIRESENPRVLIKTSAGDITLELYPDQVPLTVENFLSYVTDGSYENTVFHRVIKGFMIQGGGFTKDGKQKPTKAPIILESDNGLKNEIETVAMARTMIPDSATNQFFINTANNDFLNYGFRDEGYAVFGKVVEGMDTVKKIESYQTKTKNSMQDWPEEDIIILKIEII